MPASSTFNNAVFISLVVVFFFLGISLGQALERERQRKRLLKKLKQEQGETTQRVTTQTQSTKGREIVSSLFSTLITLKSKNEEEVYSILANFIQSNTCAAFTALLMKDRETGTYVTVGSAGLPASITEKMKLSDNDGLIRWLKEKNTPILLNDKRGDAQIKYFKRFSDSINEVMLYPLHPADELIGILVAMTRKKGGAFTENDEHLFSIISGIYSFFIHTMRLDAELEQTNLNTIIAMAIFLEKRDQYTQGHSERVKELSLKLARKLGYDQQARERLGRSAALHDIGKIGIPDSVLNKPGRLDEKEFATIQEHPDIGARMLDPLNFLKESIPGILHHHEKFDGTGYPKRLKGNQIPLDAQIISVSDVYDALTTNRPYRDAFSKETALQMMWEMNKKNFEPEVLREFIAMINEKPKAGKIEVSS